MINLHEFDLKRLIVTSIVLALLVFESKGQTANPDIRVKTRVMVLCDLTLENPERIQKVISDAGQLVRQIDDENTTLYFFTINEYPSKALLKYQRPASKYTGNISRPATEKLKAIEKRTLDILRNRVAKTLETDLRNLYDSLFKNSTNISRSCLFRCLEFANRELEESAGPDDFKMVVFLSDMVVKCNSSFCGNRLFFTSNREKEARKSINSCDTEMRLGSVDKILVIEAPTYTEKDPNTIRPEEIYKLWRTALRQFNLEVKKINELSIVSEVPEDYAKRYLNN